MTISIRTELEQALAPIPSNGHVYLAPDVEHRSTLYDIDDALQKSAPAERAPLYVDAATTYAAGGSDDRIDRTMEAIERLAYRDQRLGFIDTTPGQVLRQQYLADPAPAPSRRLGFAPAHVYTSDALHEEELAAVRAKLQLLTLIKLAENDGQTQRSTLAANHAPGRRARIEQHHRDDWERIDDLVPLDPHTATTAENKRALTDSTRISAKWTGIEEQLTARATAIADRVLTAHPHPLGPLDTIRTVMATEHPANPTPRRAASAARVPGRPYQPAPPAATTTTTSVDRAVGINH